MKVQNIVSPSAHIFPYKRIRIFPDRDLRATILEMAMIDTRIMQRLRQTKQLGNSNVSYPTAEHSRFSHSLGVLYWTSKILTSLNDNHNRSQNLPLLNDLDNIVRNYLKAKITDVDPTIFDIDKFLGVSWFEQLARLYGLLHDITHIPFGHTIEDQAGIASRHDEDLPRLNSVFAMLEKEVDNTHHFKDVQFADALSSITNEYIYLVKSMFVIGYVTGEPDESAELNKVWVTEWEKIDKNIRKPLLMTYDIVSNTICADLMDYTLRDTLFASMPKTFDKALLTCLKIVEHKTFFYDPSKRSEKMLRLGVSISRKKIRHDIITAILDLLRIRYDLTEKVYYHHTKVIMDAMMEKILRSLPKENIFIPQEIYDNYLGDEGFLNLLQKKLEEITDINLKMILKSILDKMFKRNLYKAVFRINEGEHLSRTGKKNLNLCKDHLGRTSVEKEIIDDIIKKYPTSLEHGDIIISYPPPTMQRKIAKALIEWTDGQIFTFESLPKEARYSNEVGILTERYHSLWAMTIYVNPDKIHYVRLIESICENKFDIHNDSILKNYLKEKYESLYKSEQTIEEITNLSITIESEEIYSKTAKREFFADDIERIENTESSFEQAIRKRKDSRTNNLKEKKSKRNSSSKDSDSNNAPKLNL